MRGIPVPYVAVGLALALLIGGGYESRAQLPGMMPGIARPASDNSNPLFVAMSPPVQSELKLSDEQKLKVYELATSMTQEQREVTQAAFLSGGANPQEIMAARTQLRRKMEQSLGQIFDKKQNKRFLEIVLRAEGPLAVARPEIASRIGMSDNQSNQVHAIMLGLQRAQFQLLVSMRANGVTAGGPGLNRAAVDQFGAASANLRKEAIQRVSRVLNQKQKDSFNDMLGEPFDLARLQSGAPSSGSESSKSDAKTADAKTDETKTADAKTEGTTPADDPKDDDTKTEKPKTTAKKKGRKTQK